MMMKLYLNLLPYQRTKLFSTVTNTREMISVTLNALEYLQYWHGNVKSPKRPYMLVDLDKTHRIYLVDKDKIVSFLFVLNIKVGDVDLFNINNYVYSIHLNRHKISAREISEAKQILTGCADSDSLYCFSANDVDSIYSIESFHLFEHLLFLEWGYLRFDHDPSHAIVDVHPTDHFDVNFTQRGSYKLELSKPFDVDDIIDFISKETRCAKVVL